MSWICPKCNTENSDYVIEGVEKNKCLCGYDKSLANEEQGIPEKHAFMGKGFSGSAGSVPAAVLFRIIAAFLIGVLFLLQGVGAPLRPGQSSLVRLFDFLFAGFWVAVGVGILKRVRPWEVAGIVCAGIIVLLSLLISFQGEGSASIYLIAALSCGFFPSKRSKQDRDRWYG